MSRPIHPPSGRRAVLLATALVAALGLLTLPVPAAAAVSATVSTGPDELLTYRAAPGQSNRLLLTSTVGEDRIRYEFDDVVPISTEDDNCEIPDASDPTRAYCYLVEGGDFVPQPLLLLGDRDDRVEVAPFFGDARIYGEAGDDTLISTDDGGAYGDEFHGGDGDDTILLTGGYDRVYGGNGDDHLAGGALGDLIYGNHGNDVIRGGPGNDNLSGGPGNDTVLGERGNDRVSGGQGRDLVIGGPGQDTVTR